MTRPTPSEETIQETLETINRSQRLRQQLAETMVQLDQLTLTLHEEILYRATGERGRTGVAPDD